MLCGARSGVGTGLTPLRAGTPEPSQGLANIRCCDIVSARALSHPRLLEYEGTVSLRFSTIWSAMLLILLSLLFFQTQSLFSKVKCLGFIPKYEGLGPWGETPAFAKQFGGDRAHFFESILSEIRKYWNGLVRRNRACV